MPQPVAIQNQSTVLADSDVQAWIAPLQAQVSQDFAPFYCDAALSFVAKGGTIPAGAFVLTVFDDSDQPGALGYHEDDTKWPEGKVFAKTVLADRSNPLVTASHELMEMLADPWVMTVCDIDQQVGGFFGGSGALIAFEVADGPEADAYSYTKAGAKVSDFVLPWWFGCPAPSGYAGRYSFTGATTVGFSIDGAGTVHGLMPGGYIGIKHYRKPQNWTTVNARLAAGLHQPTLAHVAAFQAILDKKLPPDRPHTLKADGTLMTAEEVPIGSRRWKRMRRMAA